MDGRKNNGGKREGAGRPPLGTKKKAMTFRMDPDVEAILDGVKNKSRFINGRIRQINAAGADTW